MLAVKLAASAAGRWNDRRLPRRVAEAACHINSAGGTVTFASSSLPIGRAAMVAHQRFRVCVDQPGGFSASPKPTDNSAHGCFSFFAARSPEAFASTPAAMSEPLVTPEQVKAARRLLGRTRVRLAARANTRESPIRRYEDGGRITPTLYLTAVREALESAGVIFVEENGEGPGVRLRKR
jgi:hypothetical protein